MIRTIIADPPWRERGGGKIKRGADRHYPLMSTSQNIEIMKNWLDQHELSDDLHFYLWVTNNFLVDGIRAIEELGFRYITNIIWIKNSIGLGRYFRGKHEICLFATRGRGFGVITESRSIPSVFHAKKRDHSRKPEEFYELVEKRSKGKYLYMFSRSDRPNWIMTGNEAGKYG